MMWGPAVAHAAADLAVEGATKVVDVGDLGLDRFDAQGRSRLYDPMALPFPADLAEEPLTTRPSTAPPTARPRDRR
jgi:sarcosine oxidase subunit beta